MKLVELEAEFYRRKIDPDGDAGAKIFERVGTIQAAEGIKFLCPACFQRNGGAEGTHMIRLPIKGRGDSLPGHGWDISGTSLDDLTLNPSVAVVDGCGWHGWVKNGDAA